MQEKLDQFLKRCEYNLQGHKPNRQPSCAEDSWAQDVCLAVQHIKSLMMDQAMAADSDVREAIRVRAELAEFKRRARLAARLRGAP